MNKSEQIGELAAALAKAQAEMHPAIKDSSNPFFKSKYADLASVWHACREALTKNGLGVVQAFRAPDTSRLELVTLLVHVSNQWIESVCPIVADKPGPQALGSVMSYMRRYALAAMVGVISEDDDAEEATVRKPMQKQDDEFKFKIDFTKTSSAVLCSDAQAQLLRTKMGMLGWDKAKQDRFLAHIGCKTKTGEISTKLVMKDAVNQILEYLESQKN